MSKIFREGLTEEELKKLFESDDACLEFLAGLKWSEGFTCRKCGNNNSCPGKSPHSRRCTKCKSEESATTGTIFHNCKFPVSKAFYIAYHVCKGREDISTYEFARRLSLRQMTCWNFKNKTITALGRMPSLSENEKSVIERMLAQSDPE
jgi:two-component system, sensor histidine kinase LadS